MFRTYKTLMKKLFYLPAALVLFVSCTGCNNNTEEPESPDQPVAASTAPNISYNIIAQYPHDTSSYTEGLEFHNGKLYESGGDYINSRLQYGDVKTGKVEKQHMMGTNEIFGEGISILKGKLYQLTYTTHTVYVYDVNDISKPVKTLTWPYEGWGMTNNGTDLIISTGGSDIYFVDPETFKIKNTVHVHDGSGPVLNINELEYVNGTIWANIYTTRDIIRISPETGAVTGKMNFDHLMDAKDSIGRTEVLNGIAYDSTSKSLFITGKRWNKVYELKTN